MFKIKNKKDVNPTNKNSNEEFINIDGLNDSDFNSKLNIVEDTSSDELNNAFNFEDMEDEVSNKKLKSKFFRRKKEKFIPTKEMIENVPLDFIHLDGNVPSDEFVIVENKIGPLLIFKKYLKIFLVSFLIILLTAISYFALSFKIVPFDIKGYNYKFGNNSIISKDYQPNLDELRVGDKLVYSETDNFSWSPILIDYKTVDFKSRNGAILFVENAEGKKFNIQSVDVEYIIKSESK